MTLWLDGFSVNEYFVRPFDAEATITTNSVNDERKSVTITYSDSINLDSIRLSDISGYLNAISDGNPEIQIDAEGNSVSITIIADENVYRDDGF